MSMPTKPEEPEGFDREYWLSHCEGFRVSRSGRRLGFVEQVLKPYFARALSSLCEEGSSAAGCCSSRPARSSQSSLATCGSGSRRRHPPPTSCCSAHASPTTCLLPR